METEKQPVRRGEHYGFLYEVDHLSTYTISAKNGLLKAEDGMRKLRITEKTQGIWAMECELMITSESLVIYERKNSKEVEVFPIELISNPTSVISDDKEDIYNNILLFTVAEDKKKHPGIPSEMHIFQCNKAYSVDIVDQIFKIKDEYHRLYNMNSDSIMANPLPLRNRKYDEMSSTLDTNNNLSSSGHQSGSFTNNNMPRAITGGYTHPMPGDNQSSVHDTTGRGMSTRQIEAELQTLNQCFDDIERFVARIQASSQSVQELEKRQSRRRVNTERQLGDGMLSMRSRMPTAAQFVACLQKFKHSFNLLARLRAHIHNPNAPELVHFLFTPLSLILNAVSKEASYSDLVRSVWQPLVSIEAKDLLLNCLSSKECDMWQKMGNAWTVTLDEVRSNPSMYKQMSVSAPFDPPSRLPAGKLATANQCSLADRPRTESIANASTNQSNQSAYNASVHQNMTNVSTTMPTSQLDGGQRAAPKKNKIRNYEEMKKWANTMKSKGLKVYESAHDRNANNDKELTVRAMEILEVLDDKRNWWKVRNFTNQTGYVPVTILREY